MRLMASSISGRHWKNKVTDSRIRGLEQPRIRGGRVGPLYELADRLDDRVELDLLGPRFCVLDELCYGIGATP